jgi:hypothetical protein
MKCIVLLLTARRLLLTAEAMKILFPSPCLVATSATSTPQPQQGTPSTQAHNANNNPVTGSDATERTDRICQPYV